MTRKNDIVIGSAAAIGMAILILDTKTALEGAASGIELCIRTVIPSLFPFFLLSILLTGTLTGRKIPILRPICKLLHIPDGAESILMTGFLGGYPVGAQCVSQCYESGQLSHSDARRLLVFCNNCGPAFIFGMTAELFDRIWIPWALWGIQIISAFITAALIPFESGSRTRITPTGSLTVTLALNKSIRVMASVCGWVVLFRVLICFLNRWVLWRFPVEIQVMVSGLMELSNGCIELSKIDNTGLRFVLCAGFLSFGGLCVTMQTHAVISSRLDRSLYFPGKILQCSISLILAWLITHFAFPEDILSSLTVMISLVTGVFTAILLRKMKISSSILRLHRV